MLRNRQSTARNHKCSGRTDIKSFNGVTPSATSIDQLLCLWINLVRIKKHNFVEPDGNWTWDIEIAVNEDGFPPEAGDVLSIITNKALTAADKYQFSTTKETYQFVSKNDLSKITTVPNPFVVSSIYEIGAYGTEKEVQFHHLPPQCTIRIYNIAGDLVRTLEHTDGTPLESWNLQSYNQQEIGFGVYFYHVDAPGIGEYIGKMAVIK